MYSIPDGITIVVLSVALLLFGNLLRQNAQYEKATKVLAKWMMIIGGFNLVMLLVRFGLNQL